MIPAALAWPEVPATASAPPIFTVKVALSPAGVAVMVALPATFGTDAVYAKTSAENAGESAASAPSESVAVSADRCGSRSAVGVNSTSTQSPMPPLFTAPTAKS